MNPAFDRGAPIPLGTSIEPYGEVSAVGSIDGERYYWMVDWRGDVAMLPACTLEKSMTDRNDELFKWLALWHPEILFKFRMEKMGESKSHDFGPPPRKEKKRGFG